MKIVGLMRVKNEARWIRRCIESILPVCDRVVVFDDYSDDGTPEICAGIKRVKVMRSTFEGLNEARDKNAMLDAIGGSADWALMIDGDEMLMPENAERLVRAMETSRLPCLSLPILYAWDREDQIRTDGVYGDFRRESAFKCNGIRFDVNGSGPNFHCGNVPAAIRRSRGYVETPLLHFGYMHSEDRIRKYYWYNEHDPGSDSEDRYRHMVVGDVFPRETKFRHGGPLALRAL